jgi:RNA-binding protein
MTTDNQTRKQFRAIGHKLNPVLIISNGLNDNIAAELERALNDHELIKIRVNAADRDEKQAILDAICTTHRAELIQLTGHIALLYRAALKQKRELSNLVRHAELGKS